MQDDYRKGCTCPPGFRGDGVQSCEGTCHSKFGDCCCIRRMTNTNQRVTSLSGLMLNLICIPAIVINHAVSHSRNMLAFLHFFFSLCCRYRWVQRENILSMPRLQMQKHLGELRVQMQKWFVLLTRKWHVFWWGFFSFPIFFLYHFQNCIAKWIVFV